MKFSTSVKLTLLILLLVPPPSPAQTPRAVATITKLKLGKTGEVFLTIPGARGKQKAGGLQGLITGTKIEVLNDAEVEIYFFGRQSKTVVRSDSPYEVISPKATPTSRSDQLMEIVNVLTDRKEQTAKRPQIRRGNGLILLAPRRNTRIITRLPRFQWEGDIDPAATLTVSGPKGLVWSTSNLRQDAIGYPKSAAVLLPDVYYSWHMDMDGTKYSGGRFKILTDNEVASLKARLAEIESQSDLGQATRTVLQISYLISQELYYDARERLIEALKADGDEPTLRLLLAEAYQKTGLYNLAAEQVQMASDLARRDKNRE